MMRVIKRLELDVYCDEDTSDEELVCDVQDNLNYERGRGLFGDNIEDFSRCAVIETYDISSPLKYLTWYLEQRSIRYEQKDIIQGEDYLKINTGYDHKSMSIRINDEYINITVDAENKYTCNIQEGLTPLQRLIIESHILEHVKR